MHGFKWYLSFYPNGKNKKQKGEIQLFINLKSLPGDILGISFYFQLLVKETNTSFINYGHFKNNCLSKSWIFSRIKTSQLQCLNKLTCTVRMKIIDKILSA